MPPIIKALISGRCFPNPMRMLYKTVRFAKFVYDNGQLKSRQYAHLIFFPVHLNFRLYLIICVLIHPFLIWNGCNKTTGTEYSRKK